MATTSTRVLLAAVLLASVAILASPPPAAADEPPPAEGTEEAPASGGWQAASELNLTLTQNAYSGNWEGEEVGSLSWAVTSNTTVERQLATIVHARATTKLAFGQTHSQEPETRGWRKPVKSTDLVDFESVFRFTLGGYVDPFASGHLESQFVDQSDAEKTRYLNPMKLTETFGVAKDLIEHDDREWTARLGGGLRQYIDRDRLDEDEGERSTEVTSDGGVEFVTEFTAPLAGGKINVSSRLAAFQALFYSESEALEGLPNEDHWKSIDLDWKNTFSAGITDHLMVNLYLEMLYDREIDEGARFKETLALGLAFNLL